MILHPSNIPRIVSPLINNFLGDVVTTIINTFKARVIADGGTFEAISCLNSTISTLQSINLV